MKPYKQWTCVFLGTMALALALVALANYLVDPLWFFVHQNPLNRKQYAFHERQQKTNRIAFAPFDYDTLILGSSAVAGINQNDFGGWRAFNYAMNVMIPEEFLSYSLFARQRRGRPFQTMILGLDFLGTNASRFPLVDPPEACIEKAQGRFYRPKALLSFDLLHYTRVTLQNNFDLTLASHYDRNNVKHLRSVSSREKWEEIQKQHVGFQNEGFGDYQYKNIPHILGALKRAHPGTRFLVFTTPLAEPLYRSLLIEETIRQGVSPYYQQWIKDIVAVFGQVTHFMTLNSVTQDLDNYSDGVHFYPLIGTLIARRLMQGPGAAGVPADFGLLITRNELMKCNLSPVSVCSP